MTVYCKIPRAGLGNQLFTIAHALVFAEINKKKIVFLNSFHFFMGPYIRGDRSKRNYRNFFIFQKSLLAEVINLIKYKFNNTICTREPDLSLQNTTKEDFLFYLIPEHNEYFNKLSPHRFMVRELIMNILKPEIRAYVNGLNLIDVAIHVRLGDFAKLNYSTPLCWYKEVIINISKNHPNYSFHIFTDSNIVDVQEILELNNTIYHESVNDIVDLFQMSKSRILVTSMGSTYSYWAGFLGECQMVLHDMDIRKIK
jgi:hypothetical protein